MVETLIILAAALVERVLVLQPAVAVAVVLDI
jgi:hypothetical protein